MDGTRCEMVAAGAPPPNPPGPHCPQKPSIVAFRTPCRPHPGAFRADIPSVILIIRPVKILRSLPPAHLDQPCALTIGNFDGVHLGHQGLVRTLVADAREAGLPAAVLTFEPHPREYFHALARQRGRNAGPEPVRISTLRDRLEMLASLGVDRVHLAPFDQRVAQWPAEDFVRTCLAQGLQARHIRIGTDFCFGAQRQGDFGMLKSVGQQCGIRVVAMPTVEDAGVRISSSLIREALLQADFPWAAQMLGRPYAISGRVSHGRRLGTRLGFPTLNLRFPWGRPALQGIFVVQVYGLSDDPAQAVPGVASFGTRPAVEADGAWLLEVHLLDWSGDAYGRLVRVEFLEKLRDELPFPDLDSLGRQIADDVRKARAHFQKTTDSDGQID